MFHTYFETLVFVEHVATKLTLRNAAPFPVCISRAYLLMSMLGSFSRNLYSESRKTALFSDGDMQQFSVLNPEGGGVLSC